MAKRRANYFSSKTKKKQPAAKKKGGSSGLAKHGSKLQRAAQHVVAKVIGGNGSKKKNPASLAGALPTAANSHSRRGLSEEQQDFVRQANSLAERARAREASKAAVKAAVSNRRKHNVQQKQQQNQQPPLRHPTPPTQQQAASSSTLWSGLRPASFGLERSTHQLVEETMQQMGQISGITGQPQPSAANVASNPPPPPGGSSLARAAAAALLESAHTTNNTTPVASNVHKARVANPPTHLPSIREATQNPSRNAFAALAGMDDSDSGDSDAENAEVAKATQRLKFKPASFGLPSKLKLPTKTPPVTPAPTPSGNHRYLGNYHRPSGELSADLFAAAVGEEPTEEERHYRRQLTGGDHANYEVDDDL